MRERNKEMNGLFRAFVTCFEADRFAGLWAAAVDIEEGGGDK